MFRYLPSQYFLLRSHDSFVLGKQTNDWCVCVRPVSFSTSTGQVHVSWERDRSDQENVSEQDSSAPHPTPSKKKSRK